MDFLSAIVGPVVESLLVPVKKHLGYLFSSTKHVGNMTTKMKQLDGASDDVKKHMETNNISNLEIPTGVPDWLEEVKKIKEDAERISSDVDGCFNLKTTYRAGRKAFKSSLKIEALIKENNETIWRDAQIPLGKVSSKLASTSDGDAHNYFKSREEIFKEALSLLQQDQKAQVIALCGMGGVGKTTMMEQLKKAVEDKKMFDWVVKVVIIGQKINILSIQQTVAEYIKLQLTETDKTARADRLRVTFKKMSQESKKVLVVLDDVWDKVELKDIGLSPLPNGFKILLTSRDENVCTQIAIEANSDLRVVRVKVMEKSEANNFFCHISEVSHPELKDIGSKIVRRCGFLPLAIKLIATNLKSQEKSVWRDTLRRLKKNDLDKNVQSIIDISYNFIAEEDAKAIFLLCGLFPDDFNIPVEDLTRYAWGLKLLNEVNTMEEARDRTKTCVCKLKKANLLMDSDYLECVKMHDLVLAFVVGKVSKGDHPWIINHGDVSNWSTTEMNESCRSISLTCTGMSEFPSDFNYPNVSLLRLMNGDKSLKFPDNFYEKMENLQVMAFEKLHYPLLPTSLQCSTTLRTLCLHKCSLMFDCSPIGDHLLNLEVLSFAHSGIRYLPSAIGNLVKLKLLDLTGCMDLRMDEGVLKNLVKLEELYMRVANKKGIKFTDTNYKELGERSKNLSALEVEFIENNPHSKNMSYNKLERFKISIGRYLESDYSVKEMHSSENTLKFKVKKKDELLESGMIELFSKTEVLYLEAGSGMNNLEEVLPKSVPRHSLFYNLRVLYIHNCADLRYLFTVPVARGLVKLESLRIWNCPVMEALVYSEENGIEEIRFQGLKRLYLRDLPKLEGLSCNTNNIVIHLPQLVTLDLNGLPNLTSIYPAGEYKSSIMSSGSSTIIKPFFNKQAMIPPRLEILIINNMEALKNIWPEVVDDVTCCCSLREISVEKCADLRYLFTVPVARGLLKLERLSIWNCPVMEALVYSEENGIEEIRFQGLKHLYLEDLPKLEGLSSNTNNIVIHLPQLVTLDLDGLPNLTSIYPAGEYKSSIMSSGSSTIIKPFFNKQAMIPPRLERLEIYRMEALKNIWPEVVDDATCCCSLRDISVEKCADLGYLFTVPVARGLLKLEHLTIEECPVMEALVYSEENGIDEIRFQGLKYLCLSDLPKLEGLSSNTNNIVIHLPQLVTLDLHGLPNLTSIYPAGEYKSSIMSSGSSTIIKPFFNKQAMIPPRLERLEIYRMEALKNIWPEVVDDATCCCSLRYIEVGSCDNLVNVFPRNPMPLLPHLERIYVKNCGSIQALFDIDVSEEGGGISKLRSIHVRNSERLTEVWRLKRGGAAVHINHPNDDDVIICGYFQAVEEIEIVGCKRFRNIFTPTTARFHLGALKKIYINGIKEIYINGIKENVESVGRNQEEACK
uniref:probable disease resistance protein At4g27220 n=1 Tax=Erigeron canadensis TaxID=72917 RepID=UPI001CB9D54E|nr:probable disease resistance protein At4g27220 [Erigeron canadensis]